MLTSSADYSENEPSPHRKFWGIVAAVSFFAIVVGAVSTTEFALQSRPAVIPPEIVALGHHLLDYGPNGYVLPFEIISLLLLSVLIGGIIIARKFPQAKDIPEVK
jgi:NADH-quinone oxidoreductase subunit J